MILAQLDSTVLQRTLEYRLECATRAWKERSYQVFLRTCQLLRDDAKNISKSNALKSLPVIQSYIQLFNTKIRARAMKRALSRKFSKTRPRFRFPITESLPRNILDLSNAEIHTRPSDRMGQLNLGNIKVSLPKLRFYVLLPLPKIPLLA